MDEAEHLADRIVVIGSGRIVARGTADELAAQVNAQTRISWRPAAEDPRPPGHLGTRIDGQGRGVIDTADALVSLHQLTNWATELGVPLPELNVARPTLEDVYLELTSEERSP